MEGNEGNSNINKKESGKIIKATIKKMAKTDTTIEDMNQDKTIEIQKSLKKASDTIIDCQACLNSFLNFGENALKIIENQSIPAETQLAQIKMSLGYVQKLSCRIDMKELEETIKQIEKANKDIGNLCYNRNYEKDVNLYKKENIALIEHAAELEYEIQQKLTRKSKQLCWGILDILNGNEDSQHYEIISKYKEDLRKDIIPAKINKLSQILAYLPKRKREFYGMQGKSISELQKENEALRKRNEEWDKKFNDLLDMHNKLMERLKRLEELENENVELKREIVELIGIIKLKDDEINTLKQDLAILKNRLNKLIEEARKKDQYYADKMEEMKQIFEEMRKEKEEKQKEILLLTQKCAELEKSLKEALEKLQRALEELKELRELCDSYKDQIDKYMNANSLDGFKALVSLANMILARSKRPPPLSRKDKKMIKDIFDANSTSLFDEMSRLQEEGKLYREEIRKILETKKIYKEKLRNLIGVAILIK